MKWQVESEIFRGQPVPRWLGGRSNPEMGAAVAPTTGQAIPTPGQIPRIALVLGLLLAAGAFVWALQGGIRPPGPILAVGSPAPDFALKNIDGRSVRLGDYRGKTVIVNFWATWCVPCRSEMPAIDAVAKANPNRVVVVAVDVLEGPVLVIGYVDQMHLSFEPVLDETGDVTKIYHVDSMPTSFFVAPDGTIRAINVGPMDQGAIEQNLQKAGIKAGI
jgi:thiol-disulfide isomerase/thioredoxin